jgi:alanyl-tRNA synthetase
MSQNSDGSLLKTDHPPAPNTALTLCWAGAVTLIKARIPRDTISTMQARELRKTYLEFFERKGALRLPSDSLVTDDPTLLFTVAGIVPFKKYLLDLETPPRKSITTAQKCVRTVDIDDVGDISHCTFFEMLGNFSFGDYFKAEMIPWAWEFLIDVLKLDQARLRVTVYLDDDEARDLWLHVGMPPSAFRAFPIPRTTGRRAR